MRPIIGFSVVLACVLVTAAPAAAQTGSLFVRVTHGGEPVVGATVEVRAWGEVVASTQTNAVGGARLARILRGDYTVRIAAQGYQARSLRDVTITTGSAEVLEIELEPAPVELEGLGVVAERVRIERENTEFQTTVDEVAIELLPVAHDAKQLIALTPGARPGHVWGGANFQANNYRLDGLSVNHPGMGGDLIQPSINWIERLEVRGLGSGAQYGGFQGGLVDIVTRSGSNDFGGSIRLNHENEALNASNLGASEISSEVASRVDVEGQVHGPLVTDRLFYFLSGQRVQRTARVLDHLDLRQSRFSPLTEETSDDRWFGKLTWTPRPADLVELSGGYVNRQADNYGMTGYESEGATWRHRSPTLFGNARWLHSFGDRATLDARINRFQRDERFEPYQGTERPGIRTFALLPPYAAFGNAAFTLQSQPTSTAAALIGTYQIPAGENDHLIRVGGEYTRGSFVDRRIRNGGMTWMPASRPDFDQHDPSTWSPYGSAEFIPTQWGGEVDLDADVVNAAGFIQTSWALGSRVVLSPGLRWGLWQGSITPADGPSFRAVEDRAWDPRVGLMAELDREGTWVAKGHWGRYHQDMIAQMFDRAAGSDVFTNEELWYYRGDPFTDPTKRFTEAERDALAEQGLFTRQGTVVLNETGPVEDYDQPYIDQWLVGMEKQFAGFVKVEMLYTRRTNHDMVALVDRNRATNYTRFERVRVTDATGDPLRMGGGVVVLSEVYLPNNVLLQRLRECAQGLCLDDYTMPPGMSLSDTLSLTWDPDFVLTNAPDAFRTFNQFQFNVEVAKPDWGGSFSLAFTGLRGNLDNVSGYTDPLEYGAGPYVRVNESVNASGILDNFAEREAKVSVWGKLPRDFRGGLFWTYSSGDHYAPRFRMSGLGFYKFVANARSTGNQGGSPVFTADGDPLDWRMFQDLEGHMVFVGPRGQPSLRRRAIFDIRLDREFELGDYDLRLSLDVFNVLGMDAITQVNPMVNHGRRPYFEVQPTFPPTQRRVAVDQYYQAPLERTPPRTLRLGGSFHF